MSTWPLTVWHLALSLDSINYCWKRCQSFDKAWLSRDIRPGLNHVCWRSQDEPAACSAVPSCTGEIILQVAGALVEECISPFIQEREVMEREQEKLRQDWEALSFSAASLHF